MSEKVRVITWGRGRRRTRVEKFLSHRDQQERMIKWAGGDRRTRERHREAFPLSNVDIACLKALHDVLSRGFSKVAIRDIARAAVRVYPVSYRIGLSEAQVLDCLEKMVQYKYVIGYGHLQPRYQKYLLTTKGKERLGRLATELVTARAQEQAVTWIDGLTGRRSASPRVRRMGDQRAQNRRTRIRRYQTWGY